MEVDFELDEKELIEAIMSDEEEVKESRNAEEFNSKDHSDSFIYIINNITDKWRKVKKWMESVKNLNDIFDLPNVVAECAKLNKLVNPKEKELVGLKAILISLTSEHDNFASEALIAVQYIAELVLRADKLFPKGEVEILQKYDKHYITYTSEQIACLIALGFFCLYNNPPRSFDMPYPINFINLYQEKDKILKQKFKFMLNYFEQFRLEEFELSESGQKCRRVSFERVSFSKAEVQELNDDYWLSNDLPLTSVAILDNDLIEDMENTLMVDFANQYLGGGVLHRGCVQEEILFLTFPELLAAKAICAKMQPSEAVVIVGAKRYSKYVGYGSSSTKFDGAYADKQPIDKHNRIDRTFVAIDAVEYSGYRSKISQFYEHDMLRDLNKAFIGFIGDKNEVPVKHMKAVTTGRWGCGAFNGNSELKFLQQWIAASANKRKMNFTTFGEGDCQNIDSIYKKYKGQTIADLFQDLKLLCDYVHKNESAIKSMRGINDIVYQFISNKDKKH